jgi:hypothetical protein
MFPDASLLQIFPQSSVIIDNGIFLETWSLLRYRAPRTGLIDGLYRYPSMDRKVPPLMSKDTYEALTSFYWADFQTHLTQQIGSPFLTSPTMQTINKSVLHFLSKTFPGFFSQNLRNYEQFAYYFSLFWTSKTTISTDKYTTSSTTDNTGTSLFQQLKNNIQLSLPNIRVF